MPSLSPFFVYLVSMPDDTHTHSSILYYDHLDPANPPSTDEVREHLLEAASYASSEFEFPEHGAAVAEDVNIAIFGPFFPSDALDQMTATEYNAIDIGNLP